MGLSEPVKPPKIAEDVESGKLGKGLEKMSPKGSADGSIEGDIPFLQKYSLRNIMATIRALPLLSKTLLVATVFEALLMVAYAITMLISKKEDSQFAMPMLITGLAVTYFVWHALITENTIELFASMWMAAFAIGARIAYVDWSAGESDSYSWPMALTAMVIQCICFALAIAVYTGFGWHLISRLGVDFRTKCSLERQRLYIAKAVFKALAQLDIVCQVLLLVVGLMVGIGHQWHLTMSWPITLLSIFGFLYNTGLLALLWGIITCKKLRFLWPLMIIAIPAGMVFPTMMAYLQWTTLQPLDAKPTKATGTMSYWDCLVIAGPLWGLVRLALWASFHWTLHRVKQLEAAVAAADLADNKEVAAEDADDSTPSHPELLPLMRGAWLGKLSGNRSPKRRFFQLSHDGSTLRWSWRKFVRLFYIDEVAYDENEWTITIKMTVDKDLKLKFNDWETYDTWCRGFERLLTTLMAPGGAAAAPHPTKAITGAAAFLKVLGINLTRAAPAKPFADSLEEDAAKQADVAAGESIASSTGSSTYTSQASMSMASSLSSQASSLGGGDSVSAAPSQRKKRSQMAKYLLSISKNVFSKSSKAVPGAPASGIVIEEEGEGEDVEAAQDGAAAGGGVGAGVSLAASDVSAGSSASSNPSERLHSLWVDVVDVDDIEFGRILGRGSQGVIYSAWWNDQPVAVKKFNKAEDSIHEVQMHLCVKKNEGVVELKALCEKDNAMYLVMEYFPRGTLETMLYHTAAQRWDTAKLLLIIRSLAKGLHYLHSRDPPIVHADLKPGNIFVGENQKMKVGDFGMSLFAGDVAKDDHTGEPLQRTMSSVGTVQYASPELLNEELQEGPMDATAHLKTDVYAFGVTLWEILERRRPFEGLHPFQIQSMSLLNPDSLKLPPVKIPSGLNPTQAAVMRSLARLSERCMAFKAADRPLMQDVLASLAAVITKYREARNAHRASSLPKTGTKGEAKAPLNDASNSV